MYGSGAGGPDGAVLEGDGDQGHGQGSCRKPDEGGEELHCADGSGQIREKQLLLLLC